MLYNYEELEVALKSEKEIKVTLSEDITSKVGEYELEIVNPEPGGGKVSINVKVIKGTETQGATTPPAPTDDNL